MNQFLLNLNPQIILKGKPFSCFMNSIDTVNAIMLFTCLFLLHIQTHFKHVSYKKHKYMRFITQNRCQIAVKNCREKVSWHIFWWLHLLLLSHCQDCFNFQECVSQSQMPAIDGKPLPAAVCWAPWRWQQKERNVADGVSRAAGGEGSAWVGRNPQRGPKSWNKTKNKKKGQPYRRPVSSQDADARTSVDMPGSNVAGKLRCPQLIYLRAHQGASVPRVVLQHDLLPQYDGPLWPGCCSH